MKKKKTDKNNDNEKYKESLFGLAVDWAGFFPAWAGLGQFFIPKNWPRPKWAK